MTRKLIVVCSLVATAFASASTQGRGILSGVVVGDAAKAAPIHDVVVTLTSDTVKRTTVSDERGRFTFDALPSGHFVVTASKPAYLATSYGATRPGRPGVPVVLDEGGRANVTIKLLRGGVVTGRVTDETGVGLWSAPVYALQSRWQDGQRVLARAGQNPGETTDDRGQYRIYGLLPGDYLIVTMPGFGSGVSGSARDVTATDIQRAMRELQPAGSAALGARGAGAPGAPPEGRLLGYGVVYYPGTADLSAAVPVHIGPQDEARGIDLRFIPVPVGNISGAVTAPSGVALASVVITMSPVGASAPTPGIGIGGSINGFATTRPAADGTFSISGVAPGRYTLTARASVGGRGAAPAAPAPVFWAVADVRADGHDVGGVSLPLQLAKAIEGKLVFEGSSPPPTDLTRIRISLAVAEVAGGGATVGAPPAQARADGTFMLSGVTPARYRLTATGATGGWTLAGASAGGADVLDALLDVAPETQAAGLTLTFTDRPASLTGTLQDAAGRPAPGYYVIVFSADRAHWSWQSRRIQGVRPGTTGVYTFANLPPGAYRIAAVVDVEPNEWFDPQFLESIAGSSVPVTIAAGEAKTQDLRISR
jgi:carboxypeptidase family protein